MKNTTMGIYGNMIGAERNEISDAPRKPHLPVKKKRNLKVCESSGYKYYPTPALLLKGKWLEQWGFSIDTPVTVECKTGQLIIRSVTITG